MAVESQPLWLGDRSEGVTTDFDGRLRRCHVLGRLSATDARTGPTLLWVRLDPPLILQGDEFEEVVIQGRHVGHDLDLLGDESISVYVCEILSTEGVAEGRVHPGALRILVWADVARDPAFLPETREEGFDRIFELLRRYADREGDGNVPQEHVEDGVGLGTWVQNMKRSQARGELRADWADRLADLPGWAWGVDADRAWADAWKVHGLTWLMPLEGAETVGLDPRLRLATTLGAEPPIEDPARRPMLWVYAYPPLRLDTAEPGMLILTAASPEADLRGFEEGAIDVEASHIRSWRGRQDGTREPEEVLRLGRAIIARDPALLPAMSDEDWRAGLAALRVYRDETGHCWVPFDFVQKGDHASVVPLGGWALRVRSEHRHGTLPAERSAELELVPGWEWEWLRR